MGSSILSYVDPDLGTLQVFEFDAIMRESHDTKVTSTKHPVAQGANISDHVRPELQTVSLTVRVSNTPIGQVTKTAHSPGQLFGGFQTITRELRPKVVKNGVFEITGGPVNFPITIGFVGGLVNSLRDPPQAHAPQVSEVAQSFSGSFFGFDTVLERTKRAHLHLKGVALAGVPVSLSTDIGEYPNMLIKSISAPREGTSSQNFDIELEEYRVAATASVVLVAKPKPKPAEKRADLKNKEGHKGAAVDFRPKSDIGVAYLKTRTGRY